ncbi:26S proteasome regulatory subunit 6A homolog [Zingiber officinale]|uniref:26S proteasome regulatory subunit 6A homolog n=1 Tax=Zingiber officinale TaxID=94328 RepID=UPI001C4C4B41|nr:26S proteasome regulatory subunit 6A homolog [Zingiber officinale]
MVPLPTAFFVILDSLRLKFFSPYLDLVFVSLQLFFSYFKELVGKEVTVELKNDLAIRGTLHSVDQYLNIKLENIKVVNEDKYPHMLLHLSLASGIHDEETRCWRRHRFIKELMDENHAIVSSSVGSEYYVGILSLVDKDQLEPAFKAFVYLRLVCLTESICNVLSVVGILQDEVDPMASVMKVEKAPLEFYVDIGGLDAQIQEIKEAVELPLTHPELYEDIGIRPPKGVILYGLFIH